VKFTLSWLKEHLETEAGLDEIVETLTRIGLEVEGVENPAEKLAPFTVAQVLTAERHPQADKLQVLTVDAGTGEDDPSRVRRAQCAGGAQGRVRAAGRLCPGQRPHPQGRGDPRRREPRHDVLGARAGAWRRA
jgi:hypothetical protein